MKKETRWYVLWYYTAAAWLICFIVQASSGRRFDFFTWLQLANAFLSLGAAVVNRNRHLKRQDKQTAQ